MRIDEIAEHLNGVVEGEADLEIHGVNKIEEARRGDISFVAHPKYEEYVHNTEASALIVGREFRTERSNITLVRVDDPYGAFVRLLGIMVPVRTYEPGVHPTAVIADDVQLGTDVSIGPHVVLGSGSVVGNHSVLLANTVLGEGVTIGERTVVHTNVSIYGGTRIGDNVIIHAGTVLGADGFGFVPKEDGSWEKIPHSGIVVIEDNVEIGANVTVDRATLGETRICAGVKLDNLVHVAHNVVVGRNSVIAGQAGVAGSARIGERNLIAGQVGIIGHIETVPNVIVEPQSGVSKSIQIPGRYFGSPAKEHAQALRQEGALRQLPDLLREIRDLKDRLSRLESATA